MRPSAPQPNRPATLADALLPLNPGDSKRWHQQNKAAPLAPDGSTTPPHRRLEHAQATAQGALADKTFDEPWARKEPKSRPLALPVRKKGGRPVDVNPWARAICQPGRSVQARHASRGQGQGHVLSGKPLPLAKLRRQPKPAQVNSSPPAKLPLRVRRCEAWRAMAP